MASQPSAVSCRHQPCLPTPRRPKCHLTWRTAPLHPATWPATAGSMPGAPRCPPTAVTSLPRWHSRACRQPGRAATPSRPPLSDAGAAPGAPWAGWLLGPWAWLTDCSLHAGWHLAFLLVTCLPWGFWDWKSWRQRQKLREVCCALKDFVSLKGLMEPCSTLSWSNHTYLFLIITNFLNVQLLLRFVQKSIKKNHHGKFCYALNQQRWLNGKCLPIA